ncbi:sugar kinase [Chitinophaga silvatica]|uniref:Sugar kinase n=1 Tax=Chitinophaga silvatica TaxID=2282649 RepID=A0A3E1YDX2_9BACT|nr:sugar kinase [Chitinophaga silvatica]RFS24674.1 sugar kinase [Chitinophaga silvatica]
MKPVKVITFGEILLRLSPDFAKNSAAVFVGGAEANVAASLAQWGTDVAYISKVPENGLSKDIVSQLGLKGIATDRMIWGGERIGLYYLAQGSDLKHAEVVYDRADSAFSTIEAKTQDWDALLGDAEWFHWSAITPALNENMVTICEEVLKAASRKGMTISTDLNYRSKLWQYGKHPIAVMPTLVQYCDVIMGNIWAANLMLDTELDEDAIGTNTKEAYLQQAEAVSTAIFSQYKKCKRIAFTFRFSDGPTHNRYYTFYNHDNVISISKEYETNEVVDRVGSGDCFMAGLIHMQLKGGNDQQIIDFATAAAYSKFFVKGDFNSTSEKDILKLI